MEILKLINLSTKYPFTYSEMEKLTDEYDLSITQLEKYCISAIEHKLTLRNVVNIDIRYIDAEKAGEKLRKVFIKS